MDVIDNLVFRIEHPESGNGPFSHRFDGHSYPYLGVDAMEYMEEPSEFPGFQEFRVREFNYAFATPTRLDRVVRSYARLNELGFHIAVYRAPEYIAFPDGQIAFKKDEAELIESYPVCDFDFVKYIKE